MNVINVFGHKPVLVLKKVQYFQCSSAACAVDKQFVQPFFGLSSLFVWWTMCLSTQTLQVDFMIAGCSVTVDIEIGTIPST